MKDEDRRQATLPDDVGACAGRGGECGSRRPPGRKNRSDHDSLAGRLECENDEA
jgi:hypothetical protein